MGALSSDSKEYAAWIGLNPSIADEQKLDRTLKKILGFTKQFGFQRFKMINLFALVSTDAQVMLKHAAPVGPMNDEHILKVCEGAEVIVCCWGDDGIHLGRADSILNLLSSFDLNCLGLTDEGQPRHPLYVLGSTRLRVLRKAR